MNKNNQPEELTEEQLQQVTGGNNITLSGQATINFSGDKDDKTSIRVRGSVR